MSYKTQPHIVGKPAPRLIPQHGRKQLLTLIEHLLAQLLIKPRQCSLPEETQPAAHAAPGQKRRPRNQLDALDPKTVPRKPLSIQIWHGK